VKILQIRLQQVSRRCRHLIADVFYEKDTQVNVFKVFLWINYRNIVAFIKDERLLWLHFTISTLRC